jgi:hypothetical protein
MGRTGKRRRRVWFALLIAPPVLWWAAIHLIPTGPLRDRLAAAIGRATGQPVALGGVRLGFCGGVVLTDLALGDPRDPWLRARTVTVDVSPLALLAGRVESRRGRASGVALRVHRRSDGSFEFGALGPNRSPGTRPADDRRAGDERSVVEIDLNDAQLTVIDEPTGTRLELSNVEAQSTWEPEHLVIENLSGILNGGRLTLTAQLDRTEPVPVVEGRLRVEGAALSEGMASLAVLIPVLAGAHGAVAGKLDLELELRTGGTTLRSLRDRLTGTATVALEDLRLDGVPLVAELGRGLGIPARERVGSVRGSLQIRERRVETRYLTLRVGSLPVTLIGWTAFDGRLDYTARAEGLGVRLNALADRLPDDARRWVEQLELSDRIDRVAEVRVRGTTERVRVSARELGPDEGVRGTAEGSRREPRERLRR